MAGAAGVNALLDVQMPKNEAMTCFVSYASKYWIRHTAHLTEEDGARVDVLWRTLINDRPSHVWVPWNTSLDGEGGMIEYALNNSHAYLYRHTTMGPSYLRYDIVFTFTRRWVLERTQKDEEKVQCLDELIQRCIVAGPSFVATAYCLALLTNPLEATSTQFVLHMARQYLVEIDVLDHLWDLIEDTCSELSEIAHDKRISNPKSTQMNLAAALKVLILLRNSNQSLDPYTGDVFRCLVILAEAEDNYSFKMIWDNLPKVAGWASDPQSLASLALQHAIEHNNVSLVHIITETWNLDIDWSTMDRLLRSAKEKADSIFRSKVTSLLNLTSHVIKEQPVVGNNSLKTIRIQLMNDDHNQAMESIERCFGRERPDHSSVADLSLLRKIIEWAIIYRCNKVLEQMPCLPEAVKAWPTVLLDVITTYAQHERLRREDDPERERKIFFTLVDEVQKLESNDMYLTGSDSGPFVDSQWTALHAAALWQPYAIEAVLKLWPDAIHRRTMHGLTPLTVSICGRPKKGDYSSTHGVKPRVFALLQAATTSDAEALRGDSLLSPLHCSVACCPPDITQMLVEHGATSIVSLTSTEDSEAYTILKIIALLESRLYCCDTYMIWKSRIKAHTSLEDYYKDNLLLSANLKATLEREREKTIG